MLLSIRNVKFIIKMRLFTMFITAVCVLLLIKLRWPKNKSLYRRKILYANMAQNKNESQKKFKGKNVTRFLWDEDWIVTSFRSNLC